MKIISREALGIDDVTGTIPNWVVADLLGLTIHHFGSPKAGATAEANRKLWLGVDNFHEQDEYSDIAYNFGFDDFGQILEGRGWNKRTGANGTTNANSTYLSFVYIGNSDTDAFNEKAQDACGWLIGEAFRKGVGKSVVPHKKWVQTGCPGGKISRWISSGAWRKDLEAAPTKVQFLLLDDGNILDRSVTVPIAERRDRLSKFIGQTQFLELTNKHLGEEARADGVGTVQIMSKYT